MTNKEYFMNTDEYEKRGYLNEAFKMFHLKDTKVKEYDFHYHDFYKILIVLSGNVTYNIEGRSYKLKPYDIVLVNRDFIHKPTVTAGEPYERIIFYISNDFFESHKDFKFNLLYPFECAGKKRADVLRFPAVINSKLRDIINHIEDNLTQELYAKELMNDALFTEFMITLCRMCFDNPGCYSDNAVYDQKMIDILLYINEHLDEDLSVDRISELFYISKYHMMRLFKSETGYTIHKYINEKRILMARNLIKSGTSATEACYLCGFQDYSTFLRAYKTQIGEKPSNR